MENKQPKHNKTSKILTQKQLLVKYLSTAQISNFWVKTGHSNFYRAEVTRNNFELIKTQKKEQDSESRKHVGNIIENGYEYLWNYTQNHDGGAFFGCSDGGSAFPLKKYQKFSTQIVCEIDDLPTSEQLDLYKCFSDITGLTPYLISSGGKSIHLHLLLDTPTDIEKVVYLRRLLCIVLDGDPALTNPHQPFRLPTFYRKEKAKYQEILQVGENYEPIPLLSKID